MSGVAMDAFGWTAEQFWRATPAEFFAMLDARRATNREIEEASRWRS